MNEQHFEECQACFSHTGKAGRGDGSLYVELTHGEVGPLCNQCYEELHGRWLDTVFACLVAAGASENLDEQERQIKAAGTKPSDFIRTRIAELEARLEKYEHPDDAEPVSEAWYMAEFSPRTSWEPLFVDTHVAVGFNAAGVVEFSVYPIPGSTTNVVIASCSTRGRVRRVLSALKGEP